MTQWDSDSKNVVQLTAMFSLELGRGLVSLARNLIRISFFFFFKKISTHPSIHPSIHLSIHSFRGEGREKERERKIKVREKH